MIYRAIQLIQIFLADGRTDGLTKVFQEVLADLKSRQVLQSPRNGHQCVTKSNNSLTKMASFALLSSSKCCESHSLTFVLFYHFSYIYESFSLSHNMTKNEPHLIQLSTEYLLDLTYQLCCSLTCPKLDSYLRHQMERKVMSATCSRMHQLKTLSQAKRHKLLILFTSLTIFTSYH